MRQSAETMPTERRQDTEETPTAELQHLTGRGSTPLLALADLFIQADKLVSADA